MFRDFFQRVGNFFTGAGWVDDEERRKRKKQQEAAQRPQPQQVRRPQQQPKNPYDPAGITSVPNLNAQTTLQKSQQAPAPQPPPPPKPPQYRNFFERVGDLFEANSPQDQAKRLAAGQPQTYQKQVEKNFARRNLTPAGVVKNVAGTGKALGQGIARAVATPAVSIRDAMTSGGYSGAGAQANTLQKLRAGSYADRRRAINENEGLRQVLANMGLDDPTDQNIDRILNSLQKGRTQSEDKGYTPGSWLEKMLFGSEPIQSYQRRVKGVAEQTTIPKPVAAAGILGLDLFGTGKKEVAEQGAKAVVENKSLLERLVNGVRGEDKTPAFIRKGKTIEKPTPQERYKAEQQAKRGEGNPFYEMQQQGLNPGDVNDIPAFQRRRIAENAARAQDEAATIDRQINSLPNQTIESYKFNQRRELAERIAQNPGNRDALIADYERRIAHVDNFNNLNDYKNDLIAKRAALQQVIDFNKQLEEKTTAAVAKQGEEAQQAVKTNQEQVAEMQTQPTPSGGSTPTPPPQSSPEFAANNAYQDTALPGYARGGTQLETSDLLDQLLKTRGVDTTVADKGVRIPNRMIRALTFGKSPSLGEIWKSGVVDPVSGAVSAGLRKGMYSENRATSSLFNLPRLVWARAGMSEGQKQALREVTGLRSAASTTARVIARDIKSKMDAIGNREAVNERLYRFFESPDFIERRFGDGNKLRFEDLTPQEQDIAVDLINLNKVRNRINYETGLINEEQYKMYADGMHSPRVYDINQGMPSSAPGNPNTFDATAGIQRLNLEDVPDETFGKVLESPAQSMLLRLETSLRNKAQLDSLRTLDEQKLVFDAPPNKSFTQLKGKQFGEYDGKWVDNSVASELMHKNIAKTKGGKAVEGALDTYRQSFLGTLDRAFKKTKTVFSPGTFLGNIVSNPVAFNRGAGVNALTQSTKMVKAASDLIQHRAMGKFNPLIYDLEKAGMFGRGTGRALTGEDAARVADETILRDGKWKKNPIEWFTNAYGGVDDAAKLALYENLLRKGLTREKALQRVGQFTQDYANAGRLIQALADAPVMGKPFARFAPELIRIVKNNVVYNPLGTVAGIAAFAIVQNELSKQAGETDEERDARENQVGQTKLPGTAWLDKLVGGKGRDISLNLPLWGTATNVARITGLNFPMEPGGDPSTALIKQTLPFAVPTRQNAQGETVFDPAEIVSSLALSPITDQIFNRDFMERSITDPNNKVIYENGSQTVQKYSGEQKPGEAMFNRLRTAVMNYVPLANEADAVINALGNRDDYYGKTRTPAQGILRAFGLKTEDNSPEARKQRVEKQQYFDEDLAAVQTFLQQNPDLASTWLKIKNPTRNRYTNIKDSDVITPEKWDLINSDTSGRLFNFLKQQAVALKNRDGKPLDPIYEVDPDRARFISEMRSRPSGDDIEAEEIMRATQPWYEKYEEKERKFYEAQAKWYKDHPFEGENPPKDNPRVKAYTDISLNYVKQPPLVKRYWEIRNKYGKDAASDFSKSQGDALSKQFDDYSAKRLTRINALRAIEGYDPIDPEVFNNKTFGFSMSAGGYGGYGGGGNYKDDRNILAAPTDVSPANKLDPLNPAAIPALQAFLKKLQAGSGRTGRARVTIGASSRGQG